MRRLNKDDFERISILRISYEQDIEHVLCSNINF